MIAGPSSSGKRLGKNRSEEIAATRAVIGMPRLFLEFGAGSLLIVFLLRFWIPLKDRTFQGDYLASFLLLFGAFAAGGAWEPRAFRVSNSLVTCWRGDLPGSCCY